MSGYTQYGCDKVDTGVAGKPVATNLVQPINNGATYNVQYSEKFIRNIKNSYQRKAIALASATAETSYSFSELMKGSVAGVNTRLLLNKVDTIYATIANTYSHTTSENWVFDFIYFSLPANFGELDDLTDFGISNVELTYVTATDFSWVVNVSINSIPTSVSFNLAEAYMGYERVTFTPDSNGYVLNDTNNLVEKSLYNVHTSAIAPLKPSGMLVVPRTVPTGTPSGLLSLWTGNNDGVIFDVQTVASGSSFNSIIYA